MENQIIRATFIPDQGAKLCSLIEKESGYEYVYQGKSGQYRTAQYAQDYLSGECAGVDEMFPNIDVFYYDSYPWQGIAFPDHGEVWALPWQYQIEDESLAMSVFGVKLPYRLTKKITLSEKLQTRSKKGAVCMDYDVKNMSSFPMDYIWAAHMMLQAEEGCRFEFEKELSKAYTTMSDSGMIGVYGDTFYYPYIETKEGQIYDMQVYRGSQANDYQKFYFADKLRSGQGWGRIRYPKHGSLTVRFPEEEVPYLGAIQAEGGELGINCMFLEPCTGAFDRPDLAKLHRMNSILEAKEEKKWHLELEIEKEM